MGRLFEGHLFCDFCTAQRNSQMSVGVESQLESFS